MNGGVTKIDPITGEIKLDGTFEPVYTYYDGQQLSTTEYTMQQPFTTTQGLKSPVEFGVLNQIIAGTLNDDDLQKDIDETIDLFMETNHIEASLEPDPDKLKNLETLLHAKYDNVIKAREQTFFAISDAIDIRNMYTDFVINKDQQQDVQAFQATDLIFVTHNNDKISLTNKYRGEEFDMYRGICTRTVMGSLSEIPIVVYYYNDTNIEFKVEPEDPELAGKLKDAINSEKKDAKCTYLLFPIKDTPFKRFYAEVDTFVDVTGIKNINIPTDINDVLSSSGINVIKIFEKIAERYTGLALIASDVNGVGASMMGGINVKSWLTGFGLLGTAAATTPNGNSSGALSIVSSKSPLSNYSDVLTRSIIPNIDNKPYIPDKFDMRKMKKVVQPRNTWSGFLENPSLSSLPLFQSQVSSSVQLPDYHFRSADTSIIVKTIEDISNMLSIENLPNPVISSLAEISGKTADELSNGKIPYTLSVIVNGIHGNIKIDETTGAVTYKAPQTLYNEAMDLIQSTRDALGLYGDSLREKAITAVFSELFDGENLTLDGWANTESGYFNDIESVRPHKKARGKDGISIFENPLTLNGYQLRQVSEHYVEELYKHMNPLANQETTAETITTPLTPFVAKLPEKVKNIVVDSVLGSRKISALEFQIDITGHYINSVYTESSGAFASFTQETGQGSVDKLNQHTSALDKAAKGYYDETNKWRPLDAPRNVLVQREIDKVVDTRSRQYDTTAVVALKQKMASDAQKNAADANKAKIESEAAARMAKRLGDSPGWQNMLSYFDSARFIGLFVKGFFKELTGLLVEIGIVGIAAVNIGGISAGTGALILLGTYMIRRTAAGVKASEEAYKKVQKVKMENKLVNEITKLQEMVGEDFRRKEKNNVFKTAAWNIIIKWTPGMKPRLATDDQMKQYYEQNKGLLAGIASWSAYEEYIKMNANNPSNIVPTIDAPPVPVPPLPSAAGPALLPPPPPPDAPDEPIIPPPHPPMPTPLSPPPPPDESVVLSPKPLPLDATSTAITILPPPLRKDSWDPNERTGLSKYLLPEGISFSSKTGLKKSQSSVGTKPSQLSQTKSWGGGSRRRLLSGKRRATRGGKKAKINRTKKHPRQKKRRTNTRRKRS